MNNPKRGEIWSVDWSPSRGSEQKGTRPSLILQPDSGNKNENYPNTIVLTISTKGKNIPFHLQLNPTKENGLTIKSFIKCEQILTISKERLIKRIGFVNKDFLDKIENAVKIVLGFD